MIMGRLFWKILFTFWLTLLITVSITAFFTWQYKHIDHHNHHKKHEYYDIFDLYFEEEKYPHKPHKKRPPHRSKLTQLLTLLLIGILGSFISSFLLAWYFAKPIHTLRQAFHNLANGDFNQKIKDKMGKRRDELSELGVAFDEMTQQLNKLIASQRRLLHDVSHELRSPLARLQVSVGLARQQPELIDECLNRIEYETTRLDQLIDEVLTLSRLEANTNQSKKETINITELLKHIIDDCQFEAHQQHKKIIFANNIEDAIFIKGYPNLLARALENILRNAINYTRTEVLVHIKTTKNLLYIMVDDNGLGVQDSELEHIFEPFKRGSQKEKALNKKGYGLGLSIAKQSIKKHQGSIHASNLPEAGLRITIRLSRKISITEH
jgi:two-component system OmpR family sensor kinase